MKVIFLDIDGVLNSEASFRYEIRRKILDVGMTLSHVACSNLQYVLEQDSSIRLVISSTWRKMGREKLKTILGSYGLDVSKILGNTPVLASGDRAQEIMAWLDQNPGITRFVILDDDNDVLNVKDPRGHVFQTTPEDGLLFKQSKAIARLFRGTEVKSA